MHNKNAVFLLLLILGAIAWYNSPPVRIPNYIPRGDDRDYAALLGGLRAELSQMVPPLKK